jgi:Zn-dependent peptidase ImmA (M78 family)
MTADIRKAQNLALKVLEDNFIIEDPVDIIDLCKNYGITVVSATFKDPLISAYIDYDLMKIVVSDNDSRERQRFSIAHELGHFLMHKPKLMEKEEDHFQVEFRKTIVDQDKEEIEKEANAFAAYLLVPPRVFKKFRWASKEEIASLCVVSKQMINYRLTYA